MILDDSARNLLDFPQARDALRKVKGAIDLAENVARLLIALIARAAVFGAILAAYFPILRRIIPVAIELKSEIDALIVVLNDIQDFIAQIEALEALTLE